jgi:glutathione S-transferase
MCGERYVCADRFTMADISFSYALLLATTLGLQNDFPAKLVPYWEGLQRREGFKRALRAETQPSTSA